MRASKDRRYSRAVALRGPLKRRPPHRVTVMDCCSRPVRFPNSRHGFAFSRHVSPELCSSPMKEGAGKTGSRLAPMDRYARSRLRYNAQRETGQPEASRPSLRNGWNGLCRALPGERCTIAPVALRMAMCVSGRTARITARLDAQTPGARTTRFGRTPITPVVRARCPLTVARPAKSFAPMCPASTAARPACRDDRDTPLFLGPE